LGVLHRQPGTPLQVPDERRSELRVAGQTDVVGGPAQQLIRLEPLQLAVSEGHKLSDRTAVALDTLHDEQFEVWPGEMAPGYHDAVVGACRAAGFEPRLDEHGAGVDGVGYIAQGRAIGLVVQSLREQLPSGVRLLDLGSPPPLSITAVWLKDGGAPAVDRFLEVAAQVSAEHAWT
jgi:LysR substrate binding domain